MLLENLGQSYLEYSDIYEKKSRLNCVTSMEGEKLYTKYLVSLDNGEYVRSDRMNTVRIYIYIGRYSIVLTAEMISRQLTTRLK